MEQDIIFQVLGLAFTMPPLPMWELGLLAVSFTLLITIAFDYLIQVPSELDARIFSRMLRAMHMLIPRRD